MENKPGSFKQSKRIVSKNEKKLPAFLKKMYGVAKTNDQREYREVYREYIFQKYSR